MHDCKKGLDCKRGLKIELSSINIGDMTRLNRRAGGALDTIRIKEKEIYGMRTIAFICFDKLTDCPSNFLMVFLIGSICSFLTCS